MKSLAAILCLTLSGCAAGPRLIYRDVQGVAWWKHHSYASYYRYCPQGSRCCYKKLAREVHMRGDAPQCAIHEKCHADGWPDEFCEENVHWEDDR